MENRVTKPVPVTLSFKKLLTNPRSGVCEMRYPHNFPDAERERQQRTEENLLRKVWLNLHPCKALYPAGFFELSRFVFSRHICRGLINCQI